MILVLDTETTGLPKNWKKSYKYVNNWPRVIELAWQLYTDDGELIEEASDLVEPDGWTMPTGEFWQKYGFTQERNETEGKPIEELLEKLTEAIHKADLMVAHNISYDANVLMAEYLRANKTTGKQIERFCTKEAGTNYCKIPGKYPGKYKWPKLEELANKLEIDSSDIDFHRALGDIILTARCYFKMKERGIIS